MKVLQSMDLMLLIVVSFYFRHLSLDDLSDTVVQGSFIIDVLHEYLGTCSDVACLSCSF